MTTEKFFSDSYAAGSDVYARLFNDSGQVFDFSDSTFKATIAACTTPQVVATEVAGMDGTGFSDYYVSIDLATVNDLPTVGRYIVKFYDNATPAAADIAVTAALPLTVSYGMIGERATITQCESNVKSTEGLAAQVAAWLEVEGVTVDPVAIGGQVFTADSSTDVLTASGHGMSDGDSLVVVNSGGALPGGLSGLTVYYVRDSTSNTFKLAETSGGTAINITSNGTGVNKFRNPTASVSFREHGGNAVLFTKSMAVKDLQNDGAGPDVVTGPVFEAEQSSPGFTDDRSYDVVATVTIDGNSFVSRFRDVVIG